MATLDNVVIFVVFRSITLEALTASVKANHEVAAEHPAGVCALTVAHLGVSLPDAAVRKAAGEAVGAAREHLVCAAQVLAGEGFIASAMRSVVTAIEMIRPDSKPRRTFASREPAVEWMAQTAARDDAWVRGVMAGTSEVLALRTDEVPAFDTVVPPAST